MINSSKTKVKTLTEMTNREHKDLGLILILTSSRHRIINQVDILIHLMHLETIITGNQTMKTIVITTTIKCQTLAVIQIKTISTTLQTSHLAI
jgi:hypothetical protein